MLRFRLKNVGALDEAEIDLADLTVICGENNTGKTYAAYAIYGLLREWRELSTAFVRQRLALDGESRPLAEYDINDLFVGKMNECLTEIAKAYASKLQRALGARRRPSTTSTITMMTDEDPNLIVRSYQKELPRDDFTVMISKGPDEHVVRVVGNGAPRYLLRYYIADAMADIVFSGLVPRVHISSAERTGISIFRTELDLARTRLLKAIQDMDSRDLREPEMVFLPARYSSAYAWPVEDNIDFVRELEMQSGVSSEILEANPSMLDAFERILGGAYEFAPNRGIMFRSKAHGNPSVAMNEASSCVRALLDVGFYIRCKARPGDLFIIDEPELNLHPKNQCLMARLLVRLVNAGVKVLITTHSDYFVRELNTMIMLAQRTELARAVQTREGYDDTELLDPGRVRLYVTRTLDVETDGDTTARSSVNSLVSVAVLPDTGIGVATFDDTIRKINEVQDEILFG